jgi:caffeoyl-CoA O-methyltransferase
MDQVLFNRVDRYVQELFIGDDTPMKEALRYAAEAGLPNISVSPPLGKLLMLMARMCGARRILEIGLLAGYSAIWLARALPEDGKLISLEYSPAHARVAQTNLERAGVEGRVETRIGAALDLLPALADEGGAPFDMIFIDADKGNYSAYFDWAVKLSRPGSVIVADNVIREGRVLEENSSEADTQAIAAFNAALAADQRVDAVITPLIGIKGFDGIATAVVRE